MQVIFEIAFNCYLEGKMDVLEKFCADTALGYFKVLLKKRELDVRPFLSG